MKSTMTSSILPLKILLIENDPAAAAQIRKALAVGLVRMVAGFAEVPRYFSPQ